MKELTERLLGATKKKLFRTKPIYETRGLASDEELLSFESQHGSQFPEDLRH